MKPVIGERKSLLIITVQSHRGIGLPAGAACSSMADTVWEPQLFSAECRRLLSLLEGWRFRARCPAHSRQLSRIPACNKGFGALGRIRTSDPRNRNPMLYPAELRAPGPGIGPQPTSPDRGWRASTGWRSDAFELAERLANKKPFPPRSRRDAAGSHQVVLKRPKCGCCATRIIGRPGGGDGCVLATLRLG